MKKYKFLGLNTMDNKCCVLSCRIPFDDLVPDELKASDFSHSTTGLCGRDDIERTLKLEGLRLTGKKILLEGALAFFGEDHGSGFSGWAIFVDVIAETADASEEPPEEPHWYDIAVREGRAEPVARIKQGKTYLYEDGRSCAIFFPNDRDTVDKYNEILAKEQ